MTEGGKAPTRGRKGVEFPALSLHLASGLFLELRKEYCPCDLTRSHDSTSFLGHFNSGNGYCDLL